jgi:membrane-bound metal-dependent hydrolase YbcI (DUF457 family)
MAPGRTCHGRVRAYSAYMPLPPAHMLFGAAAAEGVAAATSLPRYRAWMVGAVVALLPDLDFGIRLLTGEYAPIERSSLHSLAATAAVMLVAGLVAGRRWAALAGAAYASHLLADLLQHQARTSVALFWPLQQRGMEPLLPLFPFVPAQRGDGMIGAAVSLFSPDAFPPLLQSTTIAAAFFFCALLASTWLRTRRGRPARQE